jgi:hypothetical protein
VRKRRCSNVEGDQRTNQRSSSGTIIRRGHPRSDETVRYARQDRKRPTNAGDGGSCESRCHDRLPGIQSQLALTRLKTRVDSVISREAKKYLRNTGGTQVRVKARINETGDVAVTGVVEGNPILNNVVRDAVVQWKFSPIRDASGVRCVDTEIPLVLKLRE